MALINIHDGRQVSTEFLMENSAGHPSPALSCCARDTDAHARTGREHPRTS